MELSVEAAKLQNGCQARREFSNLDLQDLTLSPLNPQLNLLNPQDIQDLTLNPLNPQLNPLNPQDVQDLTVNPLNPQLNPLNPQ